MQRRKKEGFFANQVAYLQENLQRFAHSNAEAIGKNLATSLELTFHPALIYLSRSVNLSLCSLLLVGGGGLCFRVKPFF